MSLMVITHQKSILDTHTEKREKNPNVTLRIVIKSQGKRAKEETKKEARRVIINIFLNDNPICKTGKETQIYRTVF